MSKLRWLGVQPSHELSEISARELPLERLRHEFVSLLEGKQAVTDFGQTGEVVGCHRLALDRLEWSTKVFVAADHGFGRVGREGNMPAPSFHELAMTSAGRGRLSRPTHTLTVAYPCRN